MPKNFYSLAISQRRVVYTFCGPGGTASFLALLVIPSCRLHTNRWKLHGRFMQLPSVLLCISSADKIKDFERHLCCHRKEPVQPASTAPFRASGRKRYNTLDFASKVVRQRGDRPLWIPPYFRRCEYTNCQLAVCDPCGENTKQERISSRVTMKSVPVLLRSRDCGLRIAKSNSLMILS